MRVLPINFASKNSIKTVQNNGYTTNSVSFGTGFVRADSKKTAMVVEVYGRELNQFVLDATAFYRKHIDELEHSQLSLEKIQSAVTRDGEKFSRRLSYGYRNNSRDKFVRVIDSNQGTNRASAEFDANGEVVYANIEGVGKSITYSVENKMRTYDILAPEGNASWSSDL